MPKPTVAIIGGTGQTGKWALKGALQRGFKVKLLARSAGKVETILKGVFPDEADVKPRLEAVTIVEGSVTDQAKLKELLDGTSVVMSFLGMVKPPEWIVEPGVKAIMGAMKAMQSPPKFLSMSSISLSDSKAQGSKAWGCCVICLVKGFMAKSCFKDLQAAEDYIMGNRDGLNVTICRATVLGDKKGYFKDYTTEKKNYKFLNADEMKGLTFDIDRQHVAEAFLDLCESSEYDNKEVSLFNVK